MDKILQAEGLTKTYVTWENPVERFLAPAQLLMDRVFKFPSKTHADKANNHPVKNKKFTALHPITFSLDRGSSLGIIGRNGSGKSTLLQLITGTLTPSAGALIVNGRVAALLELGSGFNPDFTGRENIHLNASILGMTTQEITDRFDQIVNFSEIGTFLDQPVKTYSSGMAVRLAFAVAVHTQPDLLIVDEALSVGDVFFQQKCFTKIREIRSQGTSLIFVSHDMAAIQNLCDRCLVLDKGRLYYDGPPDAAASRFYALGSTAELTPAGSNKPKSTSPLGAVDAPNILATAKSRHGNRDIEIVSASIISPSGGHTLVTNLDDTLKIKILVQAHRNINNPSIGIHIYDRMNNLVFAAGARSLKKTFPPMQQGSHHTVEISITWSVQPGDYTFSLSSSEPSPEGINLGINHDTHTGLGPVTVLHKEGVAMPFFGIARLPMDICILPPTAILQ